MLANVCVCMPIQVLYSFHLTQCTEKYIHNTHARESEEEREIWMRPKGGLALHLNGEATTSTTMAMMVMMLKNYVCSLCVYLFVHL